MKELTLQDKDVIEPLKQQAKKEGEIIATKRAFKAIKSKFGIDLSNADLESKSLDEIVAIAAEASTAKTTADVKELQDKLIAAAKRHQLDGMTYQEYINDPGNYLTNIVTGKQIGRAHV